MHINFKEHLVPSFFSEYACNFNCFRNLKCKKKQKNKTKNPEENNNSKFIYIMSGIQMRKMSIQKTHKYYKLKI